MKKYLLVHLLTFSAIFNLAAQGFDFAPVGAKWYYSELNFALKVIPHTIESVSKENYQGKWCSKLVSSSNDIVPNPVYVYSQNDTVYWYSPLTNQFEMLYDFTAEVGDSWVVGGVYSTDGHGNPIYADSVTVDSISRIPINGDSLKVWHISHSFYFDWGKRIFERAGNDQLFMPKLGLIEAYVWGLRCFDTPDTAFHFVPYPCDTIYSTISTTLAPNESAGFEVVPNPFHEKITITSGTPSAVFSFFLYDQTGRMVFRQQNAVGILEINTALLPLGIYYWNVEKGGVVVKRGKSVKNWI